jgi:hypothetical protein
MPLPIIPEEISDNVSAIFSPIDILGRSSPLQGYSGGSSRVVSFSLKLHEDLYMFNTSTNEPYGTPNLYLNNLVAYLKSLVFPQYTTTIVPPEVIIVIGRTIGIRGVPKSVDVSWSGPINLDTMTYKECTVSFSMEEITDKPYNASDIYLNSDRSGGYLV